MHKFVTNLKKDEYNKFYEKNGLSFMQSYEWGIFSNHSKNQVPHYVGIKENNKILCEALLLEKKGPLGLSYFYSPRGFIIDFNNKKLLTEFVTHLKKYIKENKGIYLKIDPEIEYQEIDENGDKIENGYNNYQIFNNIIDLHFKHTGFVKNFENNQPRYTFIIDLEKDLDELFNNIHKSVRKKIKKTDEYNMLLTESNDVDTFVDLLFKTCEKDDFVPYKREYYKDAMKYMDGKYKLFELTINPKEIYNNDKVKLEELEEKLNNTKKGLNNLIETKKRLEKEISDLEPYKEKNKLVICSQMIAETKDTVWTLYIGNDDIGRNFYAVVRMYWEMIKYAKFTKHKKIDFFGTTGDTKNPPKNLGTLHKFKHNFGGKFIEFIGEFDYVNKRILYKILPIFLKIYRKIKR